MSTSDSIRRAVRCVLLTSAATATAIAATSAQAQEGDTIQEVVVTGSRLAQSKLSTTSPVAQVTAADVIAQGATKIEDLLNQLPQAFADQTATLASGSNGTATVNLRGLGSSRTLVLIDGRRMPYGSVNSSAADLNQIPASMVERIEILTGGSSAVYGSDAIAGVVNFITKKDFEGVQIDGQYSLYQHTNDFGGPGSVKLRDVIAERSATNPSQFRLPHDSVTDGNGVQGTLTVGVNSGDGRGNLTAYASYADNQEILQRDRDFSACSLEGNPTASFTCGGSPTAFPGAFTQDFVTLYTLGDGNTFRSFTPDDLYNFGPVNHFLRPDTRYSLGAIGHYELGSFADVYAQLMFTDVRSIAQIAPGGAFGNTSTINCDNPLLSAQQLATIGCDAAAIAAGDTVPLFIARRNVEGGGRQREFHNAAFRGVIGARGAITAGWDYDLSVQFSRTQADARTLNYFSVQRFTRAIDVISAPDAGGPVCRSAVDGTDPRCVPYNAFQLGGVTREALNYVQAPGLQQGTIDQSVTLGVVRGDLGTIGATVPWATESIKAAFGVESRHDELTSTTDDLLATGGLAGISPTPGIEGSTSVNEVFTELSVPLVQDRPGVRHLGVDLAYRYSDYSSGVTTDTYKIGAEWAPVEDIRFRGSFQRAIRAPNIVELFTAEGFALFDLDGDPCGAAARNPQASAEECIATGVPAALVGSAAIDSPTGQFQLNQGGNAQLQPEESDTVSFGVVLTPRFAPGLSVSLDYFDIEVDALIGTFGAGNTLDACYTLGDAAACGRIHRNDFGLLWIGNGNVDDKNINIGGLQTSGVDLNLSYTAVDLGNWGALSFNIAATYLIELITDPGAAGFPPFDCVGFHAGSCVSSLTTAVNPELRTHTRIGWTTPWNVDLALTHRYISEVTQFGAAAERIDRVLDAEHYFDLFGSWNVTAAAQVRLGANNVLDNDPPISASVGTTGNGNTYPQVYDALGRYIFGGVTVKF